ncbi:CHAT domain protein [Lacunisphaera limnophila]|uniref:CHAT domain protein n=1 Tax=Lacunisphaera limnophila TaxID=1838286 RepID=A0A1I7PI15_9BACT|nr:CHAT domain-containing protein [Lacunisphaera limnophila]AOS43268.1 CHAT domain protein [Lacunisphaera limnophila]
MLLAFPLLTHAQKPTQAQLQAALNDPYTIAFNEGYQAESLGKVRDAEAAYDRAVERAESPVDRVFALSRRGAMRARLGLWKQARADLAAALELEPDNLTAGFALLEVARGQGDFRAAADTLRRLEGLVAKYPNERTLQTQLALETPRTTAAWGDLQGALAQYQEAQAVLAATDDLAQVAQVQRETARVLLGLNDKPGARALALEALGTDLRRVGTSRRRPSSDWLQRGDRPVAEGLLLLADCQLALGERKAARENYHLAWQLAFRLVSPNELYRADLGRARASLQALQAGEKPLFFDADVAGVADLTGYEDFPVIRFEALGLLGEIQLAQGQPAAAIRSFQQAVGLVEATRAAATAAEKQNFLALQSDYYRWLTEAYVREGDAWSALAASEALKARQLRETLTADAAVGESFAATVARLQTLPAALDGSTAIVSYANADWSRTEPVAFVITGAGLAAVRLPLAALPALAGKLPLADVLAAQKKEVDARRYDLGDEIGLAGIVAYLRDCIYCEPEQMQARVEPMFATAGILHELLFGPIEARLAGKNRLLVSPSGLLAYLPFDILIGPTNRALVQDYAVTLTPSLLVTQTLAARAPGTYERPLLGFGGAVYNPEGYDQVMANVPAMKQQFDKLVGVRQAVFAGSPYAGRFGPQSNLAGTKTEVLMINELVPGSRIELGRAVSEGNIRALAAQGELRKSRVVHFAVHGMAMPAMPEMSGIILSYEDPRPGTPADRDGFLQITEIERLPLRAELVTLSACETGLGAIIAGEGVVGLTSSLFTAGADSVLASLWPVSDASSVYFMQRFYFHHLIQGLPGDLAVAEVKREFISGRAGGFRHPQYWAPFNLYGGREALPGR